MREVPQAWRKGAKPNQPGDPIFGANNFRDNIVSETKGYQLDGKVDHQFSQANRFTVRYIFFDNSITNNIGGGLNSVQWGTDFKDRQHSTAAQLITTIGSSFLNEARVQYATRTQSRVPGDQAGTGPAVTITGIANFGAPLGTNADAGFGFTEGNFQVLDNFTYLRGDHSYKFGFNANFVNDSRTQTQIQLYTFSSVDNYLLAKNGTNPKAYSTFAQFFGEPSYDYKTQNYAFFVQDDWRLYDIQARAFEHVGADVAAVGGNADHRQGRNG